MGNRHRQRHYRRASTGERLVGLIVAIAAGFGLWIFNGQPDLFKMAGSYLVAPLKNAAPGASPSSGPRATNTAGTWSCIWAPTINDDWHDDVKCFDGTTAFRPVLLADISRVDEAQMRAAAQEYEERLNAGDVADVP